MPLFSSYWIKSAFFTFLQKFSITLFGLINFMIIVRSLSKPEMGSWAIFLITITFFEAIKSALLKNAIIKFTAGSQNTIAKIQTRSSALAINVAVTLMFLSSLLMFGNQLSLFLNSETNLTPLFLNYSPALILLIFFSHYESVLIAELNFKAVFIGNFIRQLTFLLLVIFLAIGNTKLSLFSLTISLTCSILFGTIALYTSSYKTYFKSFKPSIQSAKKILGYGGFIFGSGIISNIFTNIDQLMSSKYLSASNVAYYNTANRVNNLVDTPSFVAADIIFPKGAQAANENNIEKVKYLFERMVGVLLAVTTPISIVIILFPKLIILLLAGNQYLPAAPIIQLYMIGGFLRPMQNQAANLLNAMGKSSLCFYINLIGITFNLIINYFCLKYYGLYGPALGTLITLVIIMLIWYFILKKHISFEIKNSIYWSISSYATAAKSLKAYLK